MPDKEVHKVNVRVGDDTYPFDMNELDLNDLFAIKSASGMNANEFIQGMAQGDPLAMQTLVWFCRRREGGEQARGDIMFKMGEFDVTPVTDENPTPADTAELETSI